MFKCETMFVILITVFLQPKVLGESKIVNWPVSKAAFLIGNAYAKKPAGRYPLSPPLLTIKCKIEDSFICILCNYEHFSKKNIFFLNHLQK